MNGGSVSNISACITTGSITLPEISLAYITIWSTTSKLGILATGPTLTCKLLIVPELLKYVEFFVVEYSISSTSTLTVFISTPDNASVKSITKWVSVGPKLTSGGWTEVTTGGSKSSFNWFAAVLNGDSTFPAASTPKYFTVYVPLTGITIIWFVVYDDDDKVGLEPSNV